MSWCCPKCKLPLKQNGRSLSCAANHSYDLAKQGYCNLLLANEKNSRDPGDNNDMVLARRAFLQLGHYEPMVDCIAQALRDFTNNIKLLDLGCGEGYYLRTLREKLKLTELDFFGIDISKNAIRKAAGQDKQSEYSVASCFNIPLEDAMFDVALSIFSPLSEKETARVLSKNGLLIRVSPGAKHLWEIREAIYSEAKPHDKPKSLQQFELLREEHVASEVLLKNKDDIKNLLHMTPYFWHGHSEQKEMLLAMEQLTIQTDFVVQFYRPLVRTIWPTDKGN